jgi:hypothetical protein
MTNNELQRLRYLASRIGARLEIHDFELYLVDRATGRLIKKGTEAEIEAALSKS